MGWNLYNDISSHKYYNMNTRKGTHTLDKLVQVTHLRLCTEHWDIPLKNMYPKI